MNVKEKMYSPAAKKFAKAGAVVTSVALVATLSIPTTALAQPSDMGNGGQSMSQGGGTPPSMPSGEGGGEAPGGEAPGGAPGGGMGGANTQSFDYSGNYSGIQNADGEELTLDGTTVEATESLTNALLAQNGGTLKVSNTSVNKSGDASDGDSCNFYGVNSIALSVNEGSLLAIDNSSLNATSEGSNGVFATDSATAYVYKTTITTSSDNSRGLDATYAGTIVADDVTVDTQGNHCAGIATDRGGGYVSAWNSDFSTAGSGSPILYSTGCIEVTNITGTATGSQIAGMEGLNTIRIWNSDLTSTLTGATASDPIADGIIIYQSTSGDAETTTGERALFQVVDSTLTSSIQSGAMFYVTNTSADIVLSGTTLDFDSNAANLITIAGNDSNNWGTAGSNGGDVTFTAIDEILEGDIEVDNISTLALYLTEGTTYTGAISSEGTTSVVLDSTATWVVTDDSTISSLDAASGSKIVDESGKTVTIVSDGSTVVSGDSSVTLTVTGEYSTSGDTGSAVEVSENTIETSDFEEYYGVTLDSETATTVTSNTAPVTSSTETQEVETSWWDNIINFFKSLF